MSLLSRAASAAGRPVTATGTLPVTVVVCAYTEDRWDQTRNAVASVLAQSPRPAQTILVIDHNPALAERAHREVAGIAVIENDSTRGLSGARNTGLAAATEPVTVFLDDDAEARPGWLASLVEPYQDPSVVATGGGVYPRWPQARPRWLPPTFDWVIGCSYLGLPTVPGAIRNPIGASMSVRTEPAMKAGAFDASVGRVGRRPRGCEETEMAIRLTAASPGSVVWYVPGAAVDHHVARDRLTMRYFLSRCWHEGMSKADVVRLAGAPAGLQAERRQTAAVIPRAVGRDAVAVFSGDLTALARICVMIGGVAAAVAGYVAGRLRSSRIGQVRQRLSAGNKNE